jgi:hypothetical protein
MSQSKVNLGELKIALTQLVDCNRYLQGNGDRPTAMEVIGEAGIGKTSFILDVAKELDLELVKINLSQIEEVGDLVGFPIKQSKMYKDVTPTVDPSLNYTTTQPVKSKRMVVWVDEHATGEYLKKGFKFTGKNRTSSCPPEWIADKKKGGILLLDDWNRADNRFIQAIMELIDRQEYISWKLPKDWHIILTANPDDGNYMVNSIDTAQKTRFTSIQVKFDVDIWATWAEGRLDTRCINFLLMHPELVTEEVNARCITTFFKSISNLSSFSNNLPLIQMFGEGSVGDEFASLFTLFINNKLDKLPTPKDIITKDDSKAVYKNLKDTIGTGMDYRADIASTLATRISNFAVFYSKSNTINKKIVDRLFDLCTMDIFTSDLKYLIIRGLINGNQKKFSSLLNRSEMIKMSIK